MRPNASKFPDMHAHALERLEELNHPLIPKLYYYDDIEYECEFIEGKDLETYIRKTDEHGPKMVPTPLQNQSWRGSGGHLGATLVTRCFQDLIFDDLGSIFPLRPVWTHVGHHF